MQNFTTLSLNLSMYFQTILIPFQRKGIYPISVYFQTITAFHRKGTQPSYCQI